MTEPAPDLCPSFDQQGENPRWYCDVCGLETVPRQGTTVVCKRCGAWFCCVFCANKHDCPEA